MMPRVHNATLGGNPMKPMRLKRWTGIAAAFLGVLLMGYSGSLSRLWSGEHLSTGLLAPVNWCLLIGMVTVIGGGLLIQITWEDHRG
jgi:drug/metabolite transporter (DMT)-like permease